MNKIEKNTDISIILPLFTSENQTLHTINSILEQTYKNFELIIIDNSDNNQIKNFISNIENKNCKIKYIKNEQDKTIASSLKQGVLQSSSKYVCIVEENCTISENKLEKQVEYLKNNQDVALVGTFITSNNKAKEEIYNNSEICKSEQLAFWINFYNPIHTSTIMFNKEILSKHNIIYQNSLTYAYDYYFIQEIITKNLRIEVIPEKLTKVEFNNQEEDTELYRKLKNITNQEIQYGLLKRFFENNDEFFYVKNLFNNFPLSNYDKKNVKEGLNNLILKNKQLNLLNEEYINKVLVHPTHLH